MSPKAASSALTLGDVALLCRQAVDRRQDIQTYVSQRLLIDEVDAAEAIDLARKAGHAVDVRSIKRRKEAL